MIDEHSGIRDLKHRWDEEERHASVRARLHRENVLILPVTSDLLFNVASIRKVFEATLLAEAVNVGELALADRVADYVTELGQGEYIGRVTLGQLASHTSGLLLPTDHPPWPDYRYSLPDFLRVLNAWRPSEGQEPGKQRTYTHAGYVLLQLALERRFATPIAQLIEQRVFRPLDSFNQHTGTRPG